MAKVVKKNYFYGVGRRREASARARVFKGTGDNLVNGEVVGKYFPGAIGAYMWQKPFAVLGVEGKYYFTAKTAGGGKKGQLEAVVFAISRAFANSNPDKFRTPLKKAGLLSSDPRTRERRKVGMGGKSRRKRQSPKR